MKTAEEFYQNFLETTIPKEELKSLPPEVVDFFEACFYAGLSTSMHLKRKKVLEGVAAFLAKHVKEKEEADDYGNQKA